MPSRWKRWPGTGEPEDIGDGGFTDWSMQLAGNNKERLLITGLGIDRLAALIHR